MFFEEKSKGEQGAPIVVIYPKKLEAKPEDKKEEMDVELESSKQQDDGEEEATEKLKVSRELQAEFDKVFVDGTIRKKRKYVKYKGKIVEKVNGKIVEPKNSTSNKQSNDEKADFDQNVGREEDATDNKEDKKEGQDNSEKKSGSKKIYAIPAN